MDDGIMKYDQACSALAQCHKVDEVKVIRNKAAALAEYQRRAGNIELERQAMEIRIRAEMRAGELLIEMKESGERNDGRSGNPSRTNQHVSARDGARAGAQTLKDLGIDEHQSRDWQALAKNKDHVEAQLADKTGKLSTKALLAPTRKEKPPKQTYDQRLFDRWRTLAVTVEEEVEGVVGDNSYYTPPDETRDRLWKEIVSKVVRQLKRIERKAA